MYPLSINTCLFVSMADLFSHFGSSSLTVAQSFHSKTNPLSSHYWTTLRTTDVQAAEGSWQAKDHVFFSFFFCVCMCGPDREFMQVNNCMSTDNMGENLLSSFSCVSVCIYVPGSILGQLSLF